MTALMQTSTRTVRPRVVLIVVAGTVMVYGMPANEAGEAASLYMEMVAGGGRRATATLLPRGVPI